MNAHTLNDNPISGEILISLFISSHQYTLEAPRSVPCARPATVPSRRMYLCVWMGPKCVCTLTFCHPYHQFTHIMIINRCGEPNMYMLGYRCNVTGTVASHVRKLQLPAKAPSWCELNSHQCVNGSKQVDVVLPASSVVHHYIDPNLSYCR